MNRKVGRRAIVRSVLLAGGSAAFALACGRVRDRSFGPIPPTEASGPPTAPGSSTPLVRPGVPPVAAEETDVRVSADDVRRFLQETLSYHEPYFATVRDRQGDAAAQQEAAAIRAPFDQRIMEAQAGAGGTLTLRVPIVTLWGAFSFSATAYEGPLIVKDPVSILFYWDGIAGRIYDRAVNLLTCRPDRGDECRQFPSFQDEDDRQGIPGHPFRCHTSPQWVLIGNADEPLQWVKNSSGLMKSIDRCNRVGRDHIRVFAGPPHPVFGQWSVATPHEERFSFDVLPGKGGHIITSWNRAQRLWAGAWIDSTLAGDRRGWDPSVFYWDRFDWGTGGIYQKVKFDGHGFLIGVDFPDVDPRRT